MKLPGEDHSTMFYDRTSGAKQDADTRLHELLALVDFPRYIPSIFVPVKR